MKRQILLLEDDRDTAEIITLILEPEGFEIKISKEQTLSADIQEFAPALIILDYRLGDKHNGAQICDQLKADPITAKIPVVLISATNDLPEIAATCKADGYIEKPFGINNFAQVITGMLRK